LSLNGNPFNTLDCINVKLLIFGDNESDEGNKGEISIPTKSHSGYSLHISNNQTPGPHLDAGNRCERKGKENSFNIHGFAKKKEKKKVFFGKKFLTQHLIL